MVIREIEKCIEKNKNFLLSGGAGSGKTYTLMQTLNKIFKKEENAKVACITYTNVAVNEIKERSPYKNLTVSTIHDFLWTQIKPFQHDLKSAIIYLVNVNDNDKNKIKYSNEEELTEDLLENKKIEYKDYTKLKEGIISHNDIIKIANHLYGSSKFLCRITNDKYDYILIDEYQDTQKEVIEIFLKYLQQVKNKSVIGLFGDDMQGIYETGIGDIKDYIKKETVKEIKKEDNYRCSEEVIKHLNKIRELQQKQPDHPKTDPPETGNIKFVYSTENKISEIKNSQLCQDWDFSNPQETKELYLTLKLIAKEEGFPELIKKFKKNEKLFGDNPNLIVSHLLKIEEIIFLYKNEKYNEFVKKVDFKIKRQKDKEELKNKITQLQESKNKTIEEVLNLADELELLQKDDKFKFYIKNNEKDVKYESIKDISFNEIIKLYEYREKLSPYSTQHGVKGAEFDNVLLILDNGNWNKYNFKYLFENTPGKEKIIERTKKIYYVSCSRAKKNLIVFFEKPSEEIIMKAKDWFDEKNVVDWDKEYQNFDKN